MHIYYYDENMVIYVCLYQDEHLTNSFKHFGILQVQRFHGVAHGQLVKLIILNLEKEHNWIFFFMFREVFKSMDSHTILILFEQPCLGCFIVLEQELNGRLEVECLDERCLVQGQGVAHAAGLNALRLHAHAQLGMIPIGGDLSLFWLRVANLYVKINSKLQRIRIFVNFYLVGKMLKLIFMFSYISI